MYYGNSIYRSRPTWKYDSNIGADQKEVKKDIPPVTYHESIPADSRIDEGEDRSKNKKSDNTIIIIGAVILLVLFFLDNER